MSVDSVSSMRCRTAVSVPSRRGGVVRDSGLIDDAVIRIAEMYEPKRIIIYGPAAAGYVDGDWTFEMMVILDDVGVDDAKVLEREMRNHLVREMRLNGQVLVMSESDFEEDVRVVVYGRQRCRDDGVCGV